MPEINTWIDVPEIPGYTFDRYGVPEEGEWFLKDNLIDKPDEVTCTLSGKFPYRRLIYSKNPEVKISDLTWYEISQFHLIKNSPKVHQVIFTGKDKKVHELWQISNRVDHATLQYVSSRYSYFAVIGREE